MKWIGTRIGWLLPAVLVPVIIVSVVLYGSRDRRDEAAGHSTSIAFPSSRASLADSHLFFPRSGPPDSPPIATAAPQAWSLPLPAPVAVPAQPTPAPAPAPVSPPPAAPAPPAAEPAAPPPPEIREPAAVPFEAPPPAPQPPPPPPPPPPAGQHRHDYASSLLNLLNGVRTQHGLAPVSPEGSLTAAAEGYAQFHSLNANPYELSHWLDGGPGDRAWRAGYCCAVGEILVTAQSSPEYMVQLWMNSPGHRAIIVDGKYSQVGIGCYQAPHADGAGNVSEPILCVADFGALAW